MTHLLITGPGNSGTAYTAAVLKAAGLPAGHERVLPPKVALGMATVKWKGLLIEVAHVAALCPDWWERWGADQVAVQLRHPLRVVASRMASGFMRWDDTMKVYRQHRAVVAYHRPDVLSHESQLDRVLAHLLATSGAVTRADLVYRVEDLDGLLVQRLAAMVGRQVAAALPKVPRTTNSHGGGQYPDAVVAEWVVGRPLWRAVAEQHADWYRGLP